MEMTTMRNSIFRSLIGVIAGVALLGTGTACTMDPYTGQPTLSKTVIGGLLGAGTGAAIGAATGDNSKQRKKRALIGAGVGALAGGAVGGYMDIQESKLREKLQRTGVGVQRVGDEIILVMPGNITFATNSADLRQDFFDVLESVGLVLVEYERTVVEVSGHTDSTGSEEYNRKLSGDRATTVARYLRTQGVADMRLLTLAFGEVRPIASNDTSSGRQQNRRVEITLAPVTSS
jgi:outer membrane protein OmpA-like peptidoglycan-associated protein